MCGHTQRGARERRVLHKKGWGLVLVTKFFTSLRPVGLEAAKRRNNKDHTQRGISDVYTSHYSLQQSTRAFYSMRWLTLLSLGVRGSASVGCGVTTHEPLFISLLRGLLVEGLLPPGSILDAGANDGTEACLLAATAPKRIVHAIEPLQQNIKLMRSRFSNVTDNLFPFEAGLGANDRSVKIGTRAGTVKAGPYAQVHLTQTGANQVQGERKAPAQTAREIPVYRIDTLFTKHWHDERLALAHLDLEGDELSAIQGAQHTIRRDQPLMTVEVFPHHREAATKLLLNFTASLGYYAFAIDETCGLPVDCRNVLLLPQKGIERYFGSPILDAAVAAAHLYAVAAPSSRISANKAWTVDTARKRRREGFEGQIRWFTMRMAAQAGIESEADYDEVDR